MREQLSRLTAEVDEGIYVVPTRVTVAEWLDTWMTTYVSYSVKPYTLDAYERSCKQHMKVPEPRKLPSGSWFIQLRLGGESIPVTSTSKQVCIREAQAIKADHLANKRRAKITPKSARRSLTLTEAIDAYIEERSSVLSPLTIRGYRTYQKHRFQAIMGRPVDSFADDEWQSIINVEAASCAPKTLKNAWNFICGVITHATGHAPPKNLTMPGAVPAERPFLQPEEINVFVAAVKDTQYAVPALLALSSLRISEIQALDWSDIPRNPKFIRVAGSVVLDEDNKYQRKKQNKNRTSTRNVPILIPELAEAIERDRKSSGPVMEIHQNSLRVAVKKLCRKNGLPDVNVHGLRHSFVSLA